MRDVGVEASGGVKHKSNLFFLLFYLPVFFFRAASDRKCEGSIGDAELKPGLLTN